MMSRTASSSWLAAALVICGACSSEDHQLGRTETELGEDSVACETQGGQCIDFEYAACPNGVWGGTEEYPCGTNAACCFPDMPGPDVPCDSVGGTCVEYAAEACDGHWLPANTQPCEGSPAIGCCVPGE